jgi:ankyrin repeat protein
MKNKAIALIILTLSLGCLLATNLGRKTESTEDVLAQNTTETTPSLSWKEIVKQAPYSEDRKTYFNIEIRRYLQRGGDPNAKDENGNTILHEVISSGVDRKLVEFLIAKGADINAKNRIGSTALHKATYEATKGVLPDKGISELYQQVVKSLIANGADLNAKKNYGKTALDKATEEDKLGCDRLSKFSKRNNNGHS